VMAASEPFRFSTKLPPAVSGDPPGAAATVASAENAR
jgi:hypothetical protein